MHREDARRFLVSSPDAALIQVLVEQLYKLQQCKERVNVGEVSFSVEGVSVLESRVGRSCVLAAGTPIVVRIPRANYARYGIESPEEALCMADVLRNFGFDLQLLASERYVRSKLVALRNTEIEALKEAFVRNDHQRFRKEFAALCHVPYGTTKAYREGIETADLEIEKLVKIVGVLLQTKVYMFWRNSRVEN
jgi:hypothetical protein